MIALTSLSFGEILEKAGLNTLLGMLVVFAVLILISLLIYCLRFVPGWLEALDRSVGAKWRAWREKRKQQKAAGKKADAQTAEDDSDNAQGEADSAEASAENALSHAAGGVLVSEGAVQPDLTLIAVITAAIAAASDTPADGIVIRSIRRSTKSNWK